MNIEIRKICKLFSLRAGCYDSIVPMTDEWMNEYGSLIE
jgi:hypothetical protein